MSEKGGDSQPKTTKQKINSKLQKDGEEKKEINEYALYETETESFESNMASKIHATPGIMFEIDGELKHPEDMILGPASPSSSWDTSLETGIKSKKTLDTGGTYGRGRSKTKKRWKVPRKAVENHDIRVILYESKSGGNINPGTDYNHFEILSIERLEVSGDD